MFIKCILYFCKMKREAISEVLKKYVPPLAVDNCVDLILKYHVSMTITRERLTKHGDYRSPQAGHHHRITVNHNLNPFAFLITFLHEIAHLVTYNQYKHTTLPHGYEWKQNFKLLLLPFLHSTIFPDDIKKAVAAYMANPAASTCTDRHLYETLSHYNAASDYVLLYKLPPNALFKLKGYSDVMVKGLQLRKNFICHKLHSKQEYKVSPHAHVVPVTIESQKNNRQDDDDNTPVLLQEIPEGTKFRLRKQAEVFIKGPRLRTFYRCEMVQNKRLYRIRGMAHVERIYD